MRAALLVLLLLATAAAVATAHRHADRADATPDVPLRRFVRQIDGVPAPAWTPASGAVAHPDDPIAVARAFVDAHVPAGRRDFVVTDAYTTRHNGVAHVHLRQRIGALEVANSETNINVRAGVVLSANTRFYTGQAPAPAARPAISAAQALAALARHLLIDLPVERIEHVAAAHDRDAPTLTAPAISLDPIPTRLMLMQTAGGASLKLVWKMVVRQTEHWFDAYVDQDGAVMAIYDWVADELYLAYPLAVDNPSDGERKLMTDPAEPVASPLGWHDQGSGPSTTTIGNNVYAQENIDGSTRDDWIENFRPSGGDTNAYVFPIDETQEPVEYLNASITSLFFATNLVDDVFYQYGFDEVSGNFQENNFGRGGLGDDAVQANGQDGAGTNNANFATPPDGERPRMRMYLYTNTVPNRDGCLAIGTIIHEISHGISNRLTGGPSNVNCLGSGEAGGMGEGWGDFHAVLFRQRPEYTRDSVFAFGNWQRNLTDSIRPYNYATDMTINPTTYGFINGADYDGVHAKGCVWATALYDGYWNIVDKEGFEPDLYSRRGGNGMVLQDVVDGMKLQPCRPTFLDARDAILLADEINYDGAHVCDWWRAFAKRGMGIDAVSSPNGVRESFALPAACSEQ